MVRRILYSFLAIVVIACGENSKRPKFVPDEEQMALLLSDIYEVEATLSQRGTRVNQTNDKYVEYYKGVLDKHGITKAEFDSSVSWYSSHPKMYYDVYDQVISTLSQREAALKKEMMDEANAAADEEPELPKVKDYWIGKREYQLPKEETDSIMAMFPYSILVDSVHGGVINLSADYTFIKGNELDSARLVMIMCYADSTRDTLNCLIKRSFKKHSESLSKLMSEGKYLTNVEGLLFEHDTTKVANVEIDDVKLTIIPKVNSIALEQ